MPSNRESEYAEIGKALGQEVGKFITKDEGKALQWAGETVIGTLGETFGKTVGVVVDFAEIEIEYLDQQDKLDPGSGEGDPGEGGMSGSQGG
ncbi:hypothetical protein CN975_09040, partial [Bacillus cereus]